MNLAYIRKVLQRIKLTPPHWLSVVYGDCHAHFSDLAALKVRVVLCNFEQLCQVPTR
jgi:hypothetical protein